MLTTREDIATEPSPPDASEHVVMFYEQDAFLLDSLVGYFGPALAAHVPIIVVATPEHCAALETRLSDSGVDVAAARAEGTYRCADARATLDRFMVEGSPDPERFGRVVDELLCGVGPARPARVYGEMVALLVADGRPDAALALERNWNLQRKRGTFSLLCGYAMHDFGGQTMAATLEATCLAHSSVKPAESYSMLVDASAQMREIAVLQQKAASLERALRAEREARAAAEAALHVRDEFLSIASHELRTPITVLGIQAQVVLRRWQRHGEIATEQAIQALSTMHGQADKLARLVNQLLDVSRLNSGKLVVDPRRTELRRLVEEVVAVTQPLSDLHPIRVSAPAELWAEVDALRLEQVLVNLLDNAMKYTPEGCAIDVDLQTEGGWVVIRVRDYGPGIAFEKRAQIFDRFFQGQTENGRWGMGLGLYLCRHIVQQHGGELIAEFPADGGTRLVVHLPG